MSRVPYDPSPGHGQRGFVQKNVGSSVLLVPRTDAFSEWSTVAEIRGSEDNEETILSAFVSASGFLSQSPIDPAGGAGGANTFIEAQAHVQFGLGGVNMDLFCDVVLGGLVALPASYMRVSVRLAPDPDELMLANSPITIRGGISTNVRPGSINPQLSFKQGPLAPNSDGSAFPVPPFARRVHALINPLAASAKASLRFFAGNTNIGEALIPLSAAQAVAIPNDANKVVIHSDATAIIAARLVYELQT